jgi:hypothetical protein
VLRMHGLCVDNTQLPDARRQSPSKTGGDPAGSPRHHPGLVSQHPAFSLPAATGLNLR